MSQAPSAQPEYVLGRSGHERQRLIHQAELLHDLTRNAFREAGLTSGMRVLDIGCGSGDVAMLAADCVGRGGSVVAIDREPDNLAFARERAANFGYGNIEFRTADILTFSDSPFDAIVGRYILLFLPDCSAALRQLALSLRSGGLLVMTEPDFSTPWRSIPPGPLFERSLQQVYAAVQGGGINTQVAVELYRSFAEAGFPGAQLSCRHWIAGGSRSWVPQYIAELVQSLVPAIEEQGIATAQQIQADTLAERLEAESAATDRTYISYPIISAWARKP